MTYKLFKGWSKYLLRKSMNNRLPIKLHGEKTKWVLNWMKRE